MTAWLDIDQNRRAPGMSNKWIGCDAQPDIWNLSGFMEGAQGAFISGSVKGLVHRPFKSIWHEPAYGPPRFERTVDERKEISTRVAIWGDTEYAYQGNESRWWNGMIGDDLGFWSTFTRGLGELWIPMLLADAVQTELAEDPGYESYVQEWDILLAADGDPYWRMPDLQPPDWIYPLWGEGYGPNKAIMTEVKRDDEKLAPKIPVAVGKFKLANRGTKDQFPTFTLTAPLKGSKPALWWISNGSTNRMVRVPPLYKGEHVIIDTNPENRIAISAVDPVDDWTKQLLRNSELLKWLFGQYGESGISILERFHGQGFDTPCKAGEVSTLTVYCDTPGMRASVRLPQRYERAVS